MWQQTGRAVAAGLWQVCVSGSAGAGGGPCGELKWRFVCTAMCLQCILTAACAHVPAWACCGCGSMQQVVMLLVCEVLLRPLT
jgi:hypothetical protein